MPSGYEATRGKIREFEGQAYECVSIEPYTGLRDGAASYLAVWRSHCADNNDA